MEPIWDRLAAMGIRTVIGAASWAQVEPVEGEFDFSTVDAQIEAARTRGMRLVLIWFGAFKNAGRPTRRAGCARTWSASPARSCPGSDTGLFTYPGAMPKPVLSVFSADLLDADRRAFVRFMEHLAEADPEHAVVMVQVENEVGLLRDSRDRSPVAEAAWKSAGAARRSSTIWQRTRASCVPSCRRSGPGRGTGRRARGRRSSATTGRPTRCSWPGGSPATGRARGRGQGGQGRCRCTPTPGSGRSRVSRTPGTIPSGGPVGRVIDVWKAAAPSLDLVAPDIYVDDVKPVLRDYDRPDNPLFVPESRFAVGRMFWALGHHRALGFSVFGVDHASPDGQLGRACALLGEMEDVVTAAQAERRIAGVLLDEGETEFAFSLGGYDVVARDARALLGRMLLDAGVGEPPPPPPPPSETDGSPHGPSPADQRPFGIVIAEGEDQFLLVGQGVGLDFSRSGALVEVDSVEEGRFATGQLGAGPPAQRRRAAVRPSLRRPRRRPHPAALRRRPEVHQPN